MTFSSLKTAPTPTAANGTENMPEPSAKWDLSAFSRARPSLQARATNGTKPELLYCILDGVPVGTRFFKRDKK